MAYYSLCFRAAGEKEHKEEALNPLGHHAGSYPRRPFRVRGVRSKIVDQIQSFRVWVGHCQRVIRNLCGADRSCVAVAILIVAVIIMAYG
jgi:hypothetical protein